MTVTPLPTRPAQPRLHRPSVRRRSPSALADASTLTVTFEVTLSGDTRYSDAVEVLDTLRRVTDRLATADVKVTPTTDVVAPEPLPQSSSATVQINAYSRTVHSSGEPVELTRVEFDLLLFLAKHPRRVFTRGQLLASVWGYAHAGQRTVDVHIRRLRAKLGDDVPLVTTVRGVGYRLADDADLRVED